tara:strand:+ start:6857 stop:8572 length:1716 start_codon:yes stop_codon:yes gene_type:complete
MLEVFFYSYLTSIFIISSGFFFTSKILNQKHFLELNLLQTGLYGLIFLSFLALFLNFFFKLDKNINTLLFLFFLIYFFFLNKEIIKKILLISITIAFICSLILIYETTYRPDAGLYHLPYTSILNNEKIIVGLSNIHFRYGHTSIIQYLSAINNNWIFGDQGILIPLSAIYSFFLLYLIYEIKKSNNKIIIIFNFIIITFLCLKLNRYSDFGNDAPAHIFYFFLISSLIKYFEKWDKNNINQFLIVGAYIVFNKITLFIGGLISIIIIFLKKNINLLNLRIVIFLTLFTFSFFIKNFIVSGCIIFPIETTCISKAFWYDANSTRGSNAEITMIENEAWTKGWSNQKEDRVSYKEYLSNNNWISLWIETHGKRILIKLAPFIFFLFIFFILIYNINKKEIKKVKYSNFSKIKKFLILILIFNLIGILIWFIKFPVFRYGSSYIITLTAIIFLLICWNKILTINILKLKKTISYLIIFLLIILFSKNVIRISKNFNNDYNLSPWPKIYSDTKNNEKKSLFEIKINNIIGFYYSEDGLCYYNTSPCTHLFNSQFKKEEIFVEEKWGYKIFYFLK